MSNNFSKCEKSPQSAGPTRPSFTSHFSGIAFKQSEAHIAARSDNINALALTDFTSLDFAENTPLHVAARYGATRCIMFLAPALATVKNSFGEMPLDLVPDNAPLCKFILQAFSPPQSAPNFLQELWDKAIAYLGQLDFSKTPQYIQPLRDQELICNLYHTLVLSRIEFMKYAPRRPRCFMLPHDAKPIARKQQDFAAVHGATVRFLAHKLKEI